MALPGSFACGFRHERRIHLVTERRLARRALEEEGLIGEIQRMAVDQVDLHLRRPILTG